MRGSEYRLVPTSDLLEQEAINWQDILEPQGTADKVSGTSINPKFRVASDWYAKQTSKPAEGSADATEHLGTPPALWPIPDAVSFSGL